MSQQVTQDVDSDIVVILTLSNVPVTGLADTDVTVEYAKEGDSSFTAFALTPSNFTEIGNGVYTVAFTDAELDTVGSFVVVVKGASVDQSVTIVNVVEAGEATTSVAIQTCTITGHVFDGAGKPVPGAAVTALILGLPSIEGQGAAALTDDRVTVKTNSNGEFFLPVVRLADVEIVIPEANYRRTLVVPNQATANLFRDIS